MLLIRLAYRLTVRHTRRVLSIVIPALNEGARLSGTLESVSVATPWPVEIVVSDGGSVDSTMEIASEHGALMVSGHRGRGMQLAAGADRSSGDWLFFLHADTRLSGRWPVEVDRFIGRPENRRKAAYCRFALDDQAMQARKLERRVAWRSHRLGLPYGDQGLLISRGFYRILGGFQPYPIFEDVDLVRRIGRHRLVPLPVQATTSADRFRRHGYRRRSVCNVTLLTLYFLGMPPSLLARIY